MGLLDKLKQTAQDAANSVADSATKVKKKATDIVSVATDKETYAKIGQTLSDKETYINIAQATQAKLTEDKDGDGVPDILQDAGKGAVK